MNQSVAIMMGITLMISAISGIYWTLEENPDTQVQAVDPPQVVQSVNLNNSHQYWNVNPMGMGNITEIALNGSSIGAIRITCENIIIPPPFNRIGLSRIHRLQNFLWWEVRHRNREHKEY